MAIDTSISIDKRVLKSATVVPTLDLVNDTLYNLCKQYPRHNRDEVIIAKVLLIGRSYSAAIERRRNARYFSGDFYAEKVAPSLRKSKIDKWISDISQYRSATPDNFPEIVLVHKKLTDLFYEITDLNKRSLASKYLHFHLPHLFYLYDSRASHSINRIIKGELLDLPTGQICDRPYARFFQQCMKLSAYAVSHYGLAMTPRQVDVYLLKVNVSQ